MRVVASLCVSDKKGKVLLVSKDARTWNFPGGVRLKGESIKKALRRELREELKVTLKRVPTKKIVFEANARSGARTKYHVFFAERAHLTSSPKVRPGDPVRHFRWSKRPLRLRLTANVRLVLETMAIYKGG